MKQPVAEAQALAARLRDAREYLGLSQQFVAEQTGIQRSAVSDIERGTRRVESLELKKFSELYRHPISYFLGETGEVEAAQPPDQTMVALARAAQDLETDDRQELLRFAEFLRNYGGSRRP